MKNPDKLIAILKEIAIDMEKDAKDFDGKPFNGRTVAEYFGNQGAAIQALANILGVVVSERAAEQLERLTPKPLEGEVTNEPV